VKAAECLWFGGSPATIARSLSSWFPHPDGATDLWPSASTRDHAMNRCGLRDPAEGRCRGEGAAALFKAKSPSSRAADAAYRFETAPALTAQSRRQAATSPTLRSRRPTGTQAIEEAASPPMEHHSEFDPMYGPGMGRRRFSPICRLCGLASIYSVSDWSHVVLRTIMDTGARSPGRPRPIWDTGFAGDAC
jgi:hypothetical protein